MPWIQRWMCLHAIILLSCCLLFLGSQNTICFFAGATLSFVMLFIWQAFMSKSFRFILAPANIITSLRLLLVLYICYTHHSIPDVTLAILAIIILLLDGVDGYLARKFNSVSDFGAYLDMETDAFYVCSMVSVLCAQQKAGLWLMGIAGLRYAYFLLLLFFKPKNQKESRDYYAQVIAVVLMAALILPFLAPIIIYQPVLIISSFLVLWSFGKSFYEGRKKMDA